MIFLEGAESYLALSRLGSGWPGPAPSPGFFASRACVPADLPRRAAPGDVGILPPRRRDLTALEPGVRCPRAPCPPSSPGYAGCRPRAASARPADGCGSLQKKSHIHGMPSRPGAWVWTDGNPGAGFSGSLDVVMADIALPRSLQPTFATRYTRHAGAPVPAASVRQPAHVN